MKATDEFICDLAEKISMPDIYQRIRKLMDNPQAKIEDYEKLIQTDSMLAIRIMRIANSEFFGFNRQARDLYEAISLIGVIQLHDVLLSGLCMRTFYNIPQQILNFNDFWLHGVKCGIVSRRIARLCRIPANNRYFSLGLLLKIGHAAMFVKAPDLAFSALEQSRGQDQPLDKIEREYFGFDYCQLGSALMRQWHLPEVYSQIIEHHLSPAHSKPDFRAATEIVNLAHRFCEIALNDNRHTNKMLVGYPQFSAFPDNYADIITNDVSNNLDKVYEMLSPPDISQLTFAGVTV
jgi:HD-like signal output (HDOD) protein